MARGKLIVFEGIDGSGTTTQIRLLLSHLKRSGIKAEFLDCPGMPSRGPMSRLIREYLSGKHDFSPQTLFLLYSAIHLENKEKARALIRKGTTVVFDRYLPSAVAYQSSQGLDIKAAKAFVKLFAGGLKPDAIIYLKVSPEVGSSRKRKQRGGGDRHEKDLALLSKVSASYERLISENFLGRWTVIDGEMPKEKVFQEIREALRV